MAMASQPHNNASTPDSWTEKEDGKTFEIQITVEGNLLKRPVNGGAK